MEVRLYGLGYIMNGRMDGQSFRVKCLSKFDVPADEILEFKVDLCRCVLPIV